MKNTSTPASSPAQPAPLSAREIAANLLGEIDWITANAGYCDCPGRRHHSNKSSRRDCAVYLDGTPTVYCVHQSCESVIAATNKQFREAIQGGAPVEYRRLTSEDKALHRKREENERIRRRAAKALPQVLSEYTWHYEKIITDSPLPVLGNEADHWKLLLGKFQVDDVVWLGDKFDSGKPEHTRHFKTAREWLTHSSAPGPLICPVTFKNTSHARSNENVIARRFLVVESDTLTRDQVGAVFRWMHEGCELKLVAIVDTGGKSLHGWFDFDEDALEPLKLILPAYQCDPKLFTASQPVRLPGALRDGVTGKYQKLIYLSEEVSHE